MSTNQTIPKSMVSTSKPVRLLGAVAAGATAATGALAVIAGIPGWLPAVVGAIGLILSVALTAYTEQQVTPWADVAAKAVPSGGLVSGPAAPGMPVGQPAMVTDVPTVPPPAGPSTVVPL